MKRSCKTCGKPWQVDSFEADWCRSRNTALPRECASCRADKRKLEGAQLVCGKCEAEFSWPKELDLYASRFGWKRPHRCPGGCDGDHEQVRRFRGDMLAIGPVWLRVVAGFDIDAEPLPEQTPEQRARDTKVPRLEDLFKDLGSGMSMPGFGDLPSRPVVDEPTPPPVDYLPPEKLPSAESLFFFAKEK